MNTYEPHPTETVGGGWSVDLVAMVFTNGYFHVTNDMVNKRLSDIGKPYQKHYIVNALNWLEKESRS